MGWGDSGRLYRRLIKAVILDRIAKAGCGAAVARLFWEQEVGGSIPPTPTIVPFDQGRSQSYGSSYRSEAAYIFSTLGALWAASSTYSWETSA